uniref:G-protein coupled receptors family 1 profile domain-containing protein n=1 Tax=Strongyloides venezuelensis TaxID=75913 RepID=A0A0K0G458_STRVS
MNISIIISFFPTHYQNDEINNILENHQLNLKNTTDFSNMVYSKTDNLPFLIHMLSIATFNIIVYLYILYIHKKIQICLKKSICYSESAKKAQKSFSKLLFLQIYCPWIFSFFPVTVFCLFCALGGETHLLASILLRGFNWLPVLNGFIFLVASKRNRKLIKLKVKSSIIYLFSCNCLKPAPTLSTTIQKLNKNSYHGKCEEKLFI